MLEVLEALGQLAIELPETAESWAARERLQRLKDCIDRINGIFYHFVVLLSVTR
jgi:hypothetical protein